MKIGHCFSCAWWEPEDVKKPELGLCHGGVPRVIPAIDNPEDTFTVFPTTRNTDYCKAYTNKDTGESGEL